MINFLLSLKSYSTFFQIDIWYNLFWILKYLTVIQNSELNFLGPYLKKLHQCLIIKRISLTKLNNVINNHFKGNYAYVLNVTFPWW